MNGFKPLGDLREWHVITALILAAIGVIAVIVWLIKAVVWLFNHVQII